MPKVSVIIPAYNCENYLTEAIDSALSQSYKDLELIIVDDGSSDNTRSISNSYAAKYPQTVRVFHQENKGPAAARNKGISNASGEYIAFLDSDDVWLPHKLENEIRLLDNNPQTGFVYCDNYFVDENREKIPDYVRKVRLLRGNIILDLFCDFFIITSSLVLRKACFDKVGLFNEALFVGEDYDFTLRLAYAFEADVIEDKLFERRVLEKSLSRKDFVLDAKNDLHTLVSFIGAHPEFYAKNKKRVLTRLAKYRFSFGYRCLENGRNKLAFANFLASLRCSFSWGALKNIVFCLCPFKIRKAWKTALK